MYTKPHPFLGVFTFKPRPDHMDPFKEGIVAGKEYLILLSFSSS